MDRSALWKAPSLSSQRMTGVCRGLPYLEHPHFFSFFFIFSFPSIQQTSIPHSSFAVCCLSFSLKLTSYILHRCNEKTYGALDEYNTTFFFLTPSDFPFPLIIAFYFHHYAESTNELLIYIHAMDDVCIATGTHDTATVWDLG